MLANNTVPITVRPRLAALVHHVHAAHGGEHAAVVQRPIAVLLLLVCLLRLSTSMLWRTECRVLREDAVAGEEAPKEAENVHLITKRPSEEGA